MNKQFEEFVEKWTGRDMEYHSRNGTTGLEFARAAWEEVTRIVNLGEVK